MGQVGGNSRGDGGQIVDTKVGDEGIILQEQGQGLADTAGRADHTGLELGRKGAVEGTALSHHARRTCTHAGLLGGRGAEEGRYTNSHLRQYLILRT